ncbi:Tat pathway signal sequence domain protein [[Clostridium] methylpentosum DSM 5476]|uniref:Tat pathway signal sequence domain protein n=1 Tax=[Clostridium] methylpentosum DSM 5476 TaxID=537013 RepID=C0E858_9FIRM|nr:Tat pathway signal sequence domain protein [[Clostridium] methylpentosum DSM 5476]
MLNLKGITRGLFIAGVAVAGAALGAFLGPYVAKLMPKLLQYTKSAASKVVKTAKNAKNLAKSKILKLPYRSIGKISANRMTNHINVPKHLWGKVLRKVTNKGIENLIQQAIRKGSWNIGKNGISTIYYRYGGEIITVTGRIINGVFNISDAWVNRR